MAKFTQILILLSTLVLVNSYGFKVTSIKYKNPALSNSRRSFAMMSSAEFSETPKKSDETSSVLDMKEALNTVWQFTRPHTIIGSGVSLLSVFLFATPIEMWTQQIFWNKLIQAAIPSLFMNLYITGLNQITDIEIDKINKPYLVIVSGKLTKGGGIAIILLSLVAVIASTPLTIPNWPLIMTLVGSFFLGTSYSLEPFRLKKYPLVAALFIVVVRGILVNLGFFFQAKTQVLGLTQITNLFNGCKLFPKSLWSATFFGIFGLVIALMKDVPDVKGDAIHNIKSLSVEFGAKKLFRTAWNVLVGLLAGSSAIFAGLLFQPMASLETLACRSIVSLGLAIMAYDVKTRTRTVQPDQPKQVFDFYLHIWNIFYLTYLLLPFAR